MRFSFLFAILLIAATAFSCSVLAGPLVDFSYTQTDVLTGSGTLTADINIAGGPGTLTFTGALPTAAVSQNDSGYAVPAGAVGYITTADGGNPGIDNGVHVGLNGTVTMSATSGSDTYTIDVPLTMVGGLPWSYNYSTFDDPGVVDVTGNPRLSGWPGDNEHGHRHTGQNRTFAAGQDNQSISMSGGGLGGNANGDDLGFTAGIRDGSFNCPIFVDDLTFGGQIEADGGTLLRNGGSITPDPKTPFSLMLDIGPENQRVQAGHIGVPDPSAGSTPDSGNNGPEVSDILVSTGTGFVTLSISDTNAAGNDDGRIDWRDRGNSSNGASDLVQLGEDFIKNNGGIIELTLDGLPEGEYEATSYHIDPGYDQADLIQVLVDNGDGLGFVDTGATGDAGTNIGINSLTTQAILDSSASFTFTADGINPVSIIFDANSAGDTEVPLNGLMLSFTPPPVPEPSTALLFLFGAAVLAFVRRKRRNSK